jgi:hypothetical protein
MPDTFYLLDLPSQALAVQRLLSGRSEEVKLSWLGAHGSLTPVETRVSGARTVYRFESLLGLSCAFFIDGDEFVFLGDHTTYTVSR